MMTRGARISRVPNTAESLARTLDQLRYLH